MSNNREREELHKAIWSIADDLRGSVDGWDFKQYILGIMFYRYISENITNYINDGERKAGDTTFDYAKLKDSEAESERDNLVKEKGFFILPSELFCNVCKIAKNDENLNETLEKIFNNIENSAKGAESEDDFSGLFDDIDVNSNKLGSTVAKRNEKLVKILDGIASIKLGNYQDNNIDAFGDAYEFLMSMYASNAGKSGGEFYTPQEVSELLTKLAIVGKTSVNKVYDPACGSGSLLLKSAKILGKDNVRNGFFGQEINLTTYNLCRINMFLHDIDYDKFDIACEDTLTSPQHWDDEPFEVIVSNPPYSIKWAGDDNAVLINDPRYSPAGVLAPKNNADYAFIMHSLAWLATNGVAAIVCYPGILTRTNNRAEPKIRKYLIDNNFVDCIIQLPSNLFFGTDIATCIMVLRKGKKDNNVLFIDASNECYKITNNNKMSEKNIDNIVKIYTGRKDNENISKIVSNNEIESNDYNLSVSTYVEKKEIKNEIDIFELNKELEIIIEKERELRNKLNKTIIDKKILNSDKKEIMNGIYNCNIPVYKLRDLVVFKNGKGHEKSIVEDGKYVVVNSKFISTDGEIRKYANEQISPLYKKDILMVMSDLPNGRALAKCFYVDEDDQYTLNQRICSLTVKDEEKVNPRFLYYLLSRNKQLLRYDNGSDQTNLRKDDILNIEVAVPPLEAQCEIVHILDDFTLLSAELSAELKARQKQYEFYKEILLNFNGGDEADEHV